MLCTIRPSCTEDARRILILLCFSSRPLTLAELINAHASNIDGDSEFTIEDRRLDVESLVDLCSGLLELTPGPENLTTPRNSQTVRIAHHSVQKYLLSNRISRKRRCSH
ncbi:hypothetical protein BDW59DRAFT_35318 [Aspergillus cavernicola]|uniref:GPI inositol-deacylase winged helix domain-containing protein n=1 Tax=Aspergillus cavernicola TaxID=176166 RepID=A0ABR4HC34_9EURO